MKIKISIFLTIFLLVATVYAGAIIQFIQGSNESDNIKIEWQTGEETNVQKFVIERKTPQSSFTEIANISPKGNNSYYSYVDMNTYKTSDIVFIYRLKIVDNNSQISFSNEITIYHSVSSITKRTWGSIKAMFR
ncbi:MAG: hypothetical protein IPH97_10255 [Ignavibacteriales bacterium]|nr:hypothetical protein [Ignavibacteriales bacterium]